MKYTFLGQTGLKVSELCLGAMTFGTDWGWGADESESRKIFDAFTDVGGNFIDTADAYTGGTSEQYLGSFIKGQRDRFVIATKYTIGTDPENANAFGNGRKNFMASLDASLKRLETDYIDLYYAHMWDGFTPVEEVIRAMEDAIRAGKVLHFGLSDFPAWLASRADALAELMHLTRPAALQIEYNLAQRDADRELLPMAEALGLSVLDWSPLGGGVLTGKMLEGDTAGRVATGAVGHFNKYKSEQALSVAKVVVEEAKKLGCSPAQLAIAWLRQISPIHIPIIGARSAAHVADNLKAVEVTIPEDTALRLDKASRVPLGFPSDFFPEGWPAWFGEWPKTFDSRLRPLGRRALKLDEDWPRRQ
ncbi:aldo/keto reductase [Cognatiyoonia sp. IB215182]|uniref:aldo/keto reductase n=1 Tax=Cognatiyoonia sp. IB215182 TaxID=3097353 RepID=UPI002A12A930|nr:aldo/keto reductase [Cognatiyoonia sp. IB215182]MDX8350771.1 aldo/keto reductase [Cognatiyoonia sp. IB215182]